MPGPELFWKFLIGLELRSACGHPPVPARRQIRQADDGFRLSAPVGELDRLAHAPERLEIGARLVCRRHADHEEHAAIASCTVDTFTASVSPVTSDTLLSVVVRP